MAYSEDKKRISLFIESDLVKRVDDNLNLTDVSSRNEFIVEAVKFYLGYLNAEEDEIYLFETYSSLDIHDSSSSFYQNVIII